jgi:hypothetical protein
VDRGWVREAGVTAARAPRHGDNTPHTVVKRMAHVSTRRKRVASTSMI